MTDSTEKRLAAALEEQNRLLRKADRRGGCLWNLVMVLFFGIFYLAWLVIKRLVKWTIWLVRKTWAGLRWTWALLVGAVASIIRRVRGR